MRVNRRVSIWKHVRLADGKSRYCGPVLDAKDKIVPNMVSVKGVEEHHAEGNYVISFYNPHPDMAEVRTKASGYPCDGRAPACSLQSDGTRRI
jgi:hypothetical protein